MVPGNSNDDRCCFCLSATEDDKAACLMLGRTEPNVMLEWERDTDNVRDDPCPTGSFEKICFNAGDPN